MKWSVALILGLLCLQMAVFVEVTKAAGKDSDGDGTPDVGKNYQVMPVYR